VENAEAVVEALHRIAGCGEGVGDALVADHDRASRREHPPAGAEDVDRVGHVVQRLMHVDEVACAVELGVGRVGLMEGDTVFEAAAGEMAVRGGD
jgi:hypothetical protein